MWRTVSLCSLSALFGPWHALPTVTAYLELVFGLELFSGLYIHLVRLILVERKIKAVIVALT